MVIIVSRIMCISMKYNDTLHTGMHQTRDGHRKPTFCNHSNESPVWQKRRSSFNEISWQFTWQIAIVRNDTCCFVVWESRTTVTVCAMIVIGLLFPFIPLGTSTCTPSAKYRPYSSSTIPYASPTSRPAKYANRKTILICLIADRNTAPFRLLFGGLALHLCAKRARNWEI